MSFTSPFAFTLPIYALMSARVIRQCYALSTRQRQRKTAHTDAIHYLTNEPGGQSHFCEGSQRRRLPERPGHAPWGDARRLEAEHAATPPPARGCSAAGRLERGGRTPCVRRPTIEGRDVLASAPPTPARGCSAAGCPERQGHAPWGDARRLEGQDAALQPLAAEEGVGVGFKPRSFKIKSVSLAISLMFAILLSFYGDDRDKLVKGFA